MPSLRCQGLGFRGFCEPIWWLKTAEAYRLVALESEVEVLMGRTPSGAQGGVVLRLFQLWGPSASVDTLPPPLLSVSPPHPRLSPVRTLVMGCRAHLGNAMCHLRTLFYLQRPLSNWVPAQARRLGHGPIWGTIQHTPAVGG